ncbi:hypothetical protein L9F63_014573, partial [Diploptera punctata]
MSNGLENNPFSALFSSLNEAESFTQQQVELPKSGSDNECLLEKSEVEDSGIISEEAKKCLEINEIVEDIFRLTLNKSAQLSQNGIIKELVFLEDLASTIAPQDWIDIETLEQALFERLLLEDPAIHIVNNHNPEKKSSIADVHATQKEVVTYLYECYRRLLSLKNESKEELQTILSQMQGLVIRNVATALKRPELFESQDLDSQLLYLTVNDSNTKTDLEAFFDNIVNEFISDDGENDAVAALLGAFTPVLDRIHKKMAQSNLFTFNHSHFYLLHIFSTRSYLAEVFIAHSKPKNPSSGFSYSDTLIGSILCISCLPKTHDGLYEFFEKPLLQATSVTEGSIWTATEAIIENLHKLFHSLLKCSNEVRHKTLIWLADCIHANAGRGKLWNSHGLSLGVSTCVSDGFMLNLSSVLLRLCQPFSSDYSDPKLLRIDPTYCAVKVNNEEIRSKGVHMRNLAAETCLIPSLEDVARPTSETYGFVSECFYLAHKALDLGFRVTFEHLIRLNQDLARMQRAFIDAQNQAGANAEVVRAIEERIEMEMTRFLSIRAALLEPQSLSLMAQLIVATAVWLVQVTYDVSTGETPRKSYTLSQFRTVKFPLPEEVPLTLSCVPEFLIENTASFLSFVRRFSPRTLEEQGFVFLDPLLTQVLVFMGSPERMRNPHLRARLAECLESLLPHHNEEQPALNPNPLGSFYRESLFKVHPHRKQIIKSLLDVFVGIEMTGQSVAFEQKFNYRRPMYIVMDYLWQIEEHQVCFQDLAAEAEANMEAVTPPLFLRFINLLMNDAVFLLDEALSNMAQLRQMQTAREAGEWRQLPLHEREQNEGYLQHIGMIARFDNILGRETIHTLEFLTSKITSIFSHSTMVDRIASMLNYFLYHLVGPNKKNFKVKDQKEYEFNPANIVMDICKIYVHLYESDSFCLAVSQDGRSYSPQLFTLAEDVL